MKIIEKDTYVKDETKLTIKGDRLIISTKMFERPLIGSEWFESCASTLNLPLDKVKEFLLRKL